MCIGKPAKEATKYEIWNIYQVSVFWNDCNRTADVLVQFEIAKNYVNRYPEMFKGDE